MIVFRQWKSWAITAAALCGSAAWSAPASAGVLLDGRFTGVVTDITDTYGVLGSLASGDRVEGLIRYSNPLPPADYIDPTYAYFNLPVTPDGGTAMWVSLGDLELRATKDLVMMLYNFEEPNTPADSLYGDTFQFIDADTSLLTTTGLPSGYRINNLGALVGLFSTAPSRFDFPLPPSTLLPLSQYDHPATAGFLFGDIEDENGRYVEGFSAWFRLTSVTSVPEPSSALLALAALPMTAIWVRRRKSRRTVQGGSPRP